MPEKDEHTIQPSVAEDGRQITGKPMIWDKFILRPRKKGNIDRERLCERRKKERKQNYVRFKEGSSPEG
jgi:hypothetical protein